MAIGKYRYEIQPDFSYPAKSGCAEYLMKSGKRAMLDARGVPVIKYKDKVFALTKVRRLNKTAVTTVAAEYITNFCNSRTNWLACQTPPCNTLQSSLTMTPRIYFSGADFRLYRPVAQYNTSVFANKTIASATLRVTLNGPVYQDNLVPTQLMYLVAFTGDDLTGNGTGNVNDWSRFTTRISDGGPLCVPATVDFTFNAAGLPYINKTGKTKFMLIWRSDYMNEQPTGGYQAVMNSITYNNLTVSYYVL